MADKCHQGPTLRPVYFTLTVCPSQDGAFECLML